MQDHHSCKTVDGVRGSFAEWGPIDGGYDVGGLVANVSGVAVVLVGSGEHSSLALNVGLSRNWAQSNESLK